MGKKRRILVAALLAAALAGLAWLVLRPGEREPVYQGRPLSDWLSRYDAGRSKAEKQEAESAIRHIGSNAVPALLRMFRARDSALKVKLVALAKRHDFDFKIASADSRRWLAVSAFGVLRDDAKGAVPVLMEMYEQDQSLDSQSAVTVALGAIGPAAKRAIPLLLQRATSPTNSSPVRQWAIMALGAIHSEPEVVVPALTNLLRDPSLSYQTRTAQALGKFGADAKSAVPLLFQLIEDEKQRGVYHAAYSAIEALRNIDPEAAALRKAELDAVNESLKQQR